MIGNGLTHRSNFLDSNSELSAGIVLNQSEDFWGARGAAFHQASRFNPTAMISRAVDLFWKSNRRLIATFTGEDLTQDWLTADELNDRFGIEGQLKFESDGWVMAAEEKYNRKITELSLAQRSEDVGIIENLGIGLAASMIDPVNYAMAVLGPVGAASKAGTTGKIVGSKFIADSITSANTTAFSKYITTGLIQPTKIAELVGGNKILGEALSGVINETVNAAAFEFLTYNIAQYEGQNYTKLDSGVNIAMSAMFGAASRGGAEAIHQYSGAAKRIELAAEASRKQAMATATNQILQGKKVDVEHVLMLDDNVAVKTMHELAGFKDKVDRARDAIKMDVAPELDNIIRVLDEQGVNKSVLDDMLNAKQEILDGIEGKVEATKKKIATREGELADAQPVEYETFVDGELVTATTDPHANIRINAQRSIKQLSNFINRLEAQADEIRASSIPVADELSRLDDVIYGLERNRDELVKQAEGTVEGYINSLTDDLTKSFGISKEELLDGFKTEVLGNIKSAYDLDSIVPERPKKNIQLNETNTATPRAPTVEESIAAGRAYDPLAPERDILDNESRRLEDLLEAKRKKVKTTTDKPTDGEATQPKPSMDEKLKMTEEHRAKRKSAVAELAACIRGSV